MSVTELAILAVLADLPFEHLQRAGAALEDAGLLLAQLGDGSRSDSLSEAVALIAVARDGIDRGLRCLERSCAAAERYRSRLTGTPAIPASRPAGETLVSREQRLRKLHAAREALPTALPRARATGAWVDSAGTVHALRSGTDEPWYTAVMEFARARGIAPPRGVWLLARHIELQFCLRMRQHGLSQETIAVDRRPCAPGCDTLIPVFLPTGAQLTVVDRAGTGYRYRGRERPDRDA